MDVRQGYKQTDLGEIPEEWGFVRLEEVCSTRKNRKIAVPDRVAVIPMEEIPEDGIYSGYLMRKKEDAKSGVYCRTGDLLLARITPSFENGKQGIVPEIPSNIAIATTEVFPIVCKDSIEPLFLFYSLKRPLVRNILASRMTGSTGRQRVPQKVVELFRIPLPPLVEQRKIVRILSCVDEAIRKTDAFIGKYEMLKQGLMQRLLIRGIGHTKFKKTKLGEIPETWKIEKLKDLIEVKSGNYFKYSEFVPEGIKVLKIDNVSFGEISWENKSFLPVSYIKKFPDLILEKNSLVIALNRPVINGKLKLGILDDADTPSILYQRVGKLVNQKKSELLDYYLYYVMSSSFFVKEIKQISIGTDQPYINPTELVKLKIRIPPISEQVKIVSILREIDALIQKEKYSKKLLKELKKGLMQVLLTGKVRVKVD